MLDCVSRGIGMSELLCVPTILVHWLAAVRLLVESGFIDVQTVWVGPVD